MSGAATADQIAVTVHGAFGALDLLVPAGASASDVAREYATQCRLPESPTLVTASGRALDPRASLAASDVASGDLLVASFGPVPPPGRTVPTASPDSATPGGRVGAGATAWCTFAAVCAVLGGVLAAGASGEAVRTTVLALLLGAGVVGAVPTGRYAAQRAAVAPAFAGAAAFLVTWQPGEVHLPVAVGVAGLGAAVAAAAVRAADAGPRETQDVWISSGLAVFGVVSTTVLLGFAPAVAWGLLLLLALLAVRFVPGFAVDVPDQMLIDLERLAITAWSARDRARGRRGRIVIPPDGVADLLVRGSHVVNAASVAVLVVVLVAAPALLVTTAGFVVDHIGARVMVFLVGGGVLLAARSYRHAFARGALRLAGIHAWAVLTVDLLTETDPGARWYALAAALVVGAATLVAAVATGRGWRSVWWARRAEIGESLCSAFAFGALVVAAGLFRYVWEIRS